MNTHATQAAGYRIGALLADFQPDFEFSAPLPLPLEEFEERLRKVRRQAVEAGHDAIIVHAGSVGWFHASNPWLRYLCDWMREGVLIIPTDSDKPLVLLSFFTQSVLLPPGGEPLLVHEIWQIGPIGREYADRPGDSVVKTAEKCAEVLARFGLSKAQVGKIGDRTSLTFWAALASLTPAAKYVEESAILERLQKVRSPREVEMFRAAAQLISIGTQAAYHVTKPGVTDHEIMRPSAVRSWRSAAKRVMAIRLALTSSAPTAATLWSRCAAGRSDQSVHFQRDLGYTEITVRSACWLPAPLLTSPNSAPDPTAVCA
ncbi:hypothetical protein [Erwinia sp. MYb535]|uniref:hypothetical protein n=1 Tax=Erwinia sp. MYb535 TaxID=2745309 RepID=UPI0030B36825